MEISLGLIRNALFHFAIFLEIRYVPMNAMPKLKYFKNKFHLHVYPWQSYWLNQTREITLLSAHQSVMRLKLTLIWHVIRFVNSNYKTSWKFLFFVSVAKMCCQHEATLCKLASSSCVMRSSHTVTTITSRRSTSRHSSWALQTTTSIRHDIFANIILRFCGAKQIAWLGIGRGLFSRWENVTENNRSKRVE